MGACENAVSVVTGLENYLLCSVTQIPCSFQRYCIVREEAINTEGSKTCKVRTKKSESDAVIIQPEKTQDGSDEILFVIEDEPNKNTNKVKEFGVVTLVTKSYVVYDYNGNSCFRQGSFDLKIGDKIEV
jgi:hypothetical protein